MDNAKNFLLSPAAADLGLGDQLRQQVEDQMDELKKKKMRQMQIDSLGPATLALFSGGQGGGQ